MEMEFFVKPGEDEEWHQYWIDERTRWYVDLGINPDNLRHYEHPQEKLSHYSKRTVDIEYRFDFAGSRVGRARGHRQPHRLRPDHARKHSGTDLSYFDQATGERYTPYVIEPAAGLSRSLMTFLVDAYTEDEAPNTKGGVDKRIVLRLDPRLAPVKVAVLPLSRNADLSPKARDLAAELRQHWNVDFDDAGAIGRRYRRQDEIGTPFCITVDFDTLEDHAVTIRERDSMAQERVALDQVTPVLRGAAPRLLIATCSHNGRVCRRTARRRGAACLAESATLAAVAALALGGCCVLAAPAATTRTPTPSAVRRRTPTAARRGATQPARPVRRRDADRAGQPSSTFGDTATVAYEPAPGRATSARAHRDRRRARAGSSDFAGFNLDDAYKRKANYYYVRVTVENVGEDDLGGAACRCGGSTSDEHPAAGGRTSPRRSGRARPQPLPEEVRARRQGQRPAWSTSPPTRAT